MEILCVILATDESSYSSLSEDSYEYYQTDIFDQLPSIQASRPEQNRLGGLESEEKLDHGHLSRGPRDKTFTQPLRNLALCIQAKRDARWARFTHVSASFHPHIFFDKYYRKMSSF